MIYMYVPTHTQQLPCCAAPVRRCPRRNLRGGDCIGLHERFHADIYMHIDANIYTNTCTHKHTHTHTNTHSKCRVALRQYDVALDAMREEEVVWDCIGDFMRRRWCLDRIWSQFSSLNVSPLPNSLRRMTYS